MKEITVLKDNSGELKNKNDIEVIENFYNYMRTDLKLSSQKAFNIIMYLQEVLPVFPDHIEKCSHCKDLYDTWSEGTQDEKTDRFYCDSCDTYRDLKKWQRNH